MNAVNILYGGRFYLKNSYGQGTYLDTCGGFKCEPTSRFNVVTSNARDRNDVGTGVWRVVTAQQPGPGDGEPVKIGDVIHLENLYGGGSWLDTCGGASAVSPSLVYNVGTSSEQDRSGKGTGSWKVLCEGKADGEVVTDQDPIHLMNMYGTASYLDSFGAASCSSKTVYGVYTAKSPNRDHVGTGTWTFELAVSVTWTVIVDEINFDKAATKRVLADAEGNTKTLQSFSFENNSAASMKQTFATEKSFASTFEFSLSQTLSASATVKASASVPGLASVEASLTVGLTLAAGQKWVDTTTEKYAISTEISVPPYSVVKGYGEIGWVENATIPAKVVLWVSGTDRFSGKHLNIKELRQNLAVGGFDGRVLDERNDEQLLVELDANLTGSWGVLAGVRASSPKPIPSSPTSDDLPAE
jgi:hypothetical protein